MKIKEINVVYENRNPLFHNTSYKSLINILNNSELWFSKYSDLNDKTEINRPIRLFENTLSNLKGIPSKKKEIFLEVIHKFKKGLLISFGQTGDPIKDPNLIKEIYIKGTIFTFSLTYLNPNERNNELFKEVCFEIDHQNFLDELSNKLGNELLSYCCFQIIREDIKYLDVENNISILNCKISFKDYLLEVLNFLPPDDIISNFSHILFQIACLIKNDDYSFENEYRVAFPFPSGRKFSNADVIKLNNKEFLSIKNIRLNNIIKCVYLKKSNSYFYKKSIKTLENNKIKYIIVK